MVPTGAKGLLVHDSVEPASFHDDISLALALGKERKGIAIYGCCRFSCRMANGGHDPATSYSWHGVIKDGE